jgi:hypothetical protein
VFQNGILIFFHFQSRACHFLQLAKATTIASPQVLRSMLQKLSVRAIFFLLTERKAHLYKIDLSLNGERGKKKIFEEKRRTCARRNMFTKEKEGIAS